VARQIFPNEDDWDDGGTPSWRARHTRPRRKAPSLGIMFLIGYLSPFAILLAAVIGTVLFLLIRDALFG
jgi:hypothetical protein